MIYNKITNKEEFLFAYDSRLATLKSYSICVLKIYSDCVTRYKLFRWDHRSAHNNNNHYNHTNIHLVFSLYIFYAVEEFEGHNSWSYAYKMLHGPIKTTEKKRTKKWLLNLGGISFFFLQFLICILFHRKRHSVDYIESVCGRRIQRRIKPTFIIKIIEYSRTGFLLNDLTFRFNFILILQQQQNAYKRLFSNPNPFPENSIAGCMGWGDLYCSHRGRRKGMPHKIKNVVAHK